jgi:hypothetical protein
LKNGVIGGAIDFLIASAKYFNKIKAPKNYEKKNNAANNYKLKMSEKEHHPLGSNCMQFGRHRRCFQGMHCLHLQG